LLSDPQTSGGLLVSCAPAALPQVMAVLAQHGFAQACVVGSVAAMQADAPMLRVV
jgi:selenide,water dikinase